MAFFQRSVIALLLLCLGCSAQSNVPADLDRSIEHQVRVHYHVPEGINVQIGSRKSSEFQNYDTLTVILSAGNKKQEEEFLISKDNKTLVSFARMDLTKDPYAEAMKKISLDHRPWRGGNDAKVIIVNYDDFQCPFCSRMHQTLMGDIYRAYGDKVKIVYKDFPLYEIHPWAGRAAVDSNCLTAQNSEAFWSFADFVHGNGREISGDNRPLPKQFEALDEIAREQGRKFHLDPEKLNACIKAQDDSVVKASVQEAEQVGVEATPTLFINGHKIDGAVPAEQLRAAIDQALRDTGSPAVVSNMAK